MFFIFTISFVGFGCGEGRGCGGFFGAEGGAVPVVVEEVRGKESSPVVTVAGRLVPSDRADINFPHEVRVQEVYASVGSVVNKGDPLFKLAEDELVANINVAKARKTELEALQEKDSAIMRGREKLLEEGKIEQDEISRLEKEISLNEAELERIKAEIVKWTYDLERVVVTSPIAGVVTEKVIGPGSMARAGEVLLSVINENPIVVVFALSPKQAEGISTDISLKVLVHEKSEKVFAAKVIYVSPELHRVGKTFDVWASIPNEDHGLKVGMMASAEFVSDVPKQIFVIPSSAVLSKFSQPYVYKVSKGVAHKTPIAMNAITEDFVEVSGGLKGGDIVVVKGSEDLSDGAHVKIWRR